MNVKFVGYGGRSQRWIFHDGGWVFDSVPPHIAEPNLFLRRGLRLCSSLNDSSRLAHQDAGDAVPMMNQLIHGKSCREEQVDDGRHVVGKTGEIGKASRSEDFQTGTRPRTFLFRSGRAVERLQVVMDFARFIETNDLDEQHAINDNERKSRAVGSRHNKTQRRRTQFGFRWGSWNPGDP